MGDDAFYRLLVSIGGIVGVLTLNSLVSKVDGANTRTDILFE